MHTFASRNRLRPAAAALLALALAGACSDSTGPRPLPVLSSLSPDVATAGQTGITITVMGSEFRRDSEVRWRGAALPTTYVSATTLAATVPDSLLRTGGTASVTVFTPQPGGGTSGSLQFTINNPVPVVTALSPDTSRVGRSNVQVTVSGTGFVPESQVQWNGQPRPTTFQSATRLTFVAPEGDVTQGGLVPVTVVNPAPGGGTSAAALFTFQNPVPVIRLLPSSGGTAGGPGFTLTIHGSNFAGGAVVRWNGVERPATVIDPSRVQVAVSSADVATPRTVTLSVVNPLSGGIPSDLATFTVRALGPATGTVSRVSITARDLAWDPGTSRIYLSIPAANQPANTVTAVDPATGAITGSLAVGNEPAVLARSDNGQYLYVALRGPSTTSVRRIELATFTAGLEWSLGTSSLGGLQTHDMEVVPGQPNAVVVVRTTRCCASLESVTVYDNGVARPQALDYRHNANRIAFAGPATTLYAQNTLTSGFNFYRIALTASGAAVIQDTRGMVSNFATQDIVGAAERVYTNTGVVVDAERSVRTGSFPVSPAMAVEVDPVLGRAYFLTSAGIEVYDLNSFLRLGLVAIPDVQSAPAYSRLVRFGADGLAFLSGPELVLVRSPLFAP